MAFRMRALLRATTRVRHPGYARATLAAVTGGTVVGVVASERTATCVGLSDTDIPSVCFGVIVGAGAAIMLGPDVHMSRREGFKAGYMEARMMEASKRGTVTDWSNLRSPLIISHVHK